MRISVVIPACDRPEFLMEALHSVHQQSLQPHEVIVVNNGAGELDVDLPTHFRAIRAIPYMGAAQARNVGAVLTTGEYLAFLDDDDLWAADYLERVTAVLANGKVDCAVARLDELTQEGVRPLKCVDENSLRVEALLASNPGITGSNIVLRRDIFFSVGGYNARLATSEDKALVLEILLRGHSVAPVRDAQALQRAHDRGRLSASEAMAYGIAAFAEKYDRLMSPRQKLHNRYKVARYRYQASRKPLDGLTALVLRMRMAIPGASPLRRGSA